MKEPKAGDLLFCIVLQKIVEFKYVWDQKENLYCCREPNLPRPFFIRKNDLLLALADLSELEKLLYGIK